MSRGRPSAAPPRLAVRLLERWIPASEREAFVGDLLEEFRAERVPRVGAARARRWFWREALLALATLRPPRQASPAPRPGDPRVRSLAEVRK